MVKVKSSRVEEKEAVGHEEGREMNYFDAVPKDASSLVTLPAPLTHPYTRRQVQNWRIHTTMLVGCGALNLLDTTYIFSFLVQKLHARYNSVVTGSQKC